MVGTLLIVCVKLVGLTSLSAGNSQIPYRAAMPDIAQQGYTPIDQAEQSSNVGRKLPPVNSTHTMHYIHKKLDYLISLFKEHHHIEQLESINKLLFKSLKQTAVNEEGLLKMTDHMLQIIKGLVVAQTQKAASAEADEMHFTIDRITGKLENIRHYVKQKCRHGTRSDDPGNRKEATFPKDCEEAYHLIRSGSGVYTIQPEGATSPKDVWCEMEDRKWTVLMRRFNGNVSFDRNWQEFKDGFGSAAGEYWIGNEYMHLLTRNKEYDARFDMTEWFGGRSYYSVFTTFSVGSEKEKYKLRIGGETGNAKKNRMQKHDQSPFSTKDRDNEKSNINCARRYGGGWWHYLCYYVFLTGPYRSGCMSSLDHKCMVWKHNVPLKAASIKITRKN